MGAAAVGAGAAVASAAVSAGSAIAGSGSASGAISGALGQSTALDQQALATGATNYSNNQANAAPFISNGQAANSQYANLLGLNGQDAANNAMSTFQASPGYQYQLQQGLRSVDAGAASQGLYRSGAELKAEQTLGDNLANQDFSNYMGRLNSLSGLGMQGVQADNTATQNYNTLLGSITNSETGLISGAGTQQASIDGNEASALGNTASGLIKNGLYQYGINGTNPALGGNTFNGSGATSLDPGGF